MLREDNVLSFDYSENGIDLGTLQMGEKVYVAHLHCAGGTHGALTILAVAYDATCPHNCPNLNGAKITQVLTAKAALKPLLFISEGSQLCFNICTHQLYVPHNA